MKRQSVRLFVAAVLALLGPLAQKSRGDFILYNDEWLEVYSFHSMGILFDRSLAFIMTGGAVNYLQLYNSSTVTITGAINTSGGNVSDLYAYNSSAVNIKNGNVSHLYAHDSSVVDISSGNVGDLQNVSDLHAYNWSVVDISSGNVSHLYAYNWSAVDVSGGSFNYLSTYDSSVANISGGNVNAGLSASNSSTANISGGYVSSLAAYNSSTVNMSGGSVSNLAAYNSSTVDISGGKVGNLIAQDSSAVTFYGQNFRVGIGLTFDGERVLGTGILTGEWMDGTRWAVNITTNQPTATILAIPESAHKPFCVKYPRMDFNGDCKVDFADLAIMASSWLECNLVPQSACWE